MEYACVDNPFGTMVRQIYSSSIPVPLVDRLPLYSALPTMPVAVLFTNAVAAVHSAGGEPPLSISTVKFPVSIASPTVISPTRSKPVTCTLPESILSLPVLLTVIGSLSELLGHI